LIVFLRDELAIFDFKRSSGWSIGDNAQNIQVQEFASFAKVDPNLHPADLLNNYHGFITGGRSNGSGFSVCYGWKFVMNT